MSITFTAGCKFEEMGFELNVANRNACIVLRICGLESIFDYDGIIEQTKFPGVVLGCAIALENPSEFVLATKVEGRVIDCGCTADQIRMYAISMLRLVSMAMMHDSPIYWS